MGNRLFCIQTVVHSLLTPIREHRGKSMQGPFSDHEQTRQSQWQSLLPGLLPVLTGPASRTTAQEGGWPKWRTIRTGNPGISSSETRPTVALIVTRLRVLCRGHSSCRCLGGPLGGTDPFRLIVCRCSGSLAPYLYSLGCRCGTGCASFAMYAIRVSHLINLANFRCSIWVSHGFLQTSHNSYCRS